MFALYDRHMRAVFARLTRARARARMQMVVMLS